MSSASAPGKVIITGEHSVVYGYPALAGALDMRCTATITDGDSGLIINARDLDKTLYFSTQDLSNIDNDKSVNSGFDNLAGALLSLLEPEEISHEIDITSEVPIGAGLGSSAATAVAIVGAMYNHLDRSLKKEEISNHAYNAEIIAHGTPSGIDNTVSTMGGLVWFQDGKTKPLPLSEPIPLIIANTNVPRDTKSLVSGVMDRKNRNNTIMGAIMEDLGEVTQEIEETLLAKDYLRTGELFDINHGLLEAIGVGHLSLSQMVYLARKNGALGAKLTGAGGGGCMIALTSKKVKDQVRDALDIEGVDVYETTLSTQGVSFVD